MNYWQNSTEGVWWPSYFVSDIWFKDDLWEASSLGFRSSFSKLGILRMSWRVFHDRSLLGRCFRGFVLPVLEYYSAVWCSAANAYLKLLYRAVSGARFLTGSVLECDISHRRSVAVLCMLYKIRCYPVHPLKYIYIYINIWCSTWTVCASAGYTPRCSGRTSAHLCTASLQNLAVEQDFYSLLDVPLERSC